LLNGFPDGPDSPTEIAGQRWDLNSAAGDDFGSFALHLTGDTDQIKFSHGGQSQAAMLATVIVLPSAQTVSITFVGTTGTVRVNVQPGSKAQSASASDDQVGLIGEVDIQSNDAWIGQISFDRNVSPVGPFNENFTVSSAGLDNADVFQHTFWIAGLPAGSATPATLQGQGWEIGDLQDVQGNFSTQLHLTGAIDTITFPNLMPGVHVSFAAVDVLPSKDLATITFVGANGSYSTQLPNQTTTQTASVGEDHVLQGDALNPILELGAIREIILSWSFPDARFDNLRVLIVPDQSPLDESVTVAPKVTTPIDVLSHATAEAAEAGLQLPLHLASQNPVTQPDLPGSQTQAMPATDPNEIAFLYTPLPGQPLHPIANFTYTVIDATGKTATGTVHVTIDSSPVIFIENSKNNFPWRLDPVGGLDLEHGTPGPLIGYVHVSDDDGDPLSLTVVDSSIVTLTPIGVNEYKYTYSPPAISEYDPETGLSSVVSAIVGDDQFTLEARDGIVVADHTMIYHVADYPPRTASLEFNSHPHVEDLAAGPGDGPTFVVPENTGVSYYTRVLTDPFYDSTIDVPGLVHFAAPGVLINTVDIDDPFAKLPKLDPLMAVPDAADPPQHGQLHLYPDGSFNYTPQKNWSGTDDFGFYASDGYLLGADPAHLSIQQPFIVTIHVEAGPLGGGPGTPGAPVLVDLLPTSQTDLDLPADGTQFGYLPQKINVSKLVDTNQNGDYPQYLELVRPYHAIEVEPDGLAYVDLTSLYTAGLSIDQSIYVAYSNTESPTGAGFALIESGESPSRILDNPPPHGVAYLFGVQTIPLRETFSFAYALANNKGWLSNIAQVSFTVSPQARTTHTIYVHDPHLPDIFVSSLLGTTLSASFSPLPSGVHVPSDFQFPSDGLLSINVGGLNPGAEITITLTLPPGYPHITTYYKYGPDSNPHYYLFQGAAFYSDPDTGDEVISLHLQDGGAGDEDGAKDGTIHDPGAPAIYTDPARNYVASLYEDVLGRTPSTAEVDYWVKRLNDGASRQDLAAAFWNSPENRRLQVNQWSTEFLGHPASAQETARWVKLLRRGEGETAVESLILTSTEYHRAHPTLASFVCGLYHDVLGGDAGPVDPTIARLLRYRVKISRSVLARAVLRSNQAAASLAQHDAIMFLGRKATSDEVRRDSVMLRRGATAPSRIAERILASKSFYEFVNSALPSRLA
jgi:hypothetical protein